MTARAALLHASTAMMKGMVAGALGGLAGTWAMNEAQRAWTRAAGERAPESAGGKHDARDWQERDEQQNSNELAAQALARCLIGRGLTRDELSIAAPLVHFSFGAAVGAIYGAYAEQRHGGSGAGLGITLWLAADEVAMPLLGLSGPTTRRPLEMHLQSLTAHLVYGAVTEVSRRAIRSQLGRGHHRSGRSYVTNVSFQDQGPDDGTTEAPRSQRIF